MDNAEAAPAPQPGVPPGAQQVRLHSGVYPQPDGTWMTGVWFIGFPTEASAHHLAGQLEQIIKQALAPPPGMQQPMPEAPPAVNGQGGPVQ